LLIASTPTSGGHYLVDVLAGLALVPVAIAIIRWRQREPSEQMAVGFDSMSPVRD
jgi:membrane-associated phospholipid phosphatase